MYESIQIFTDDIETLAQDYASLTELLEHWKALCGDRAMPQRNDFDPVQVPELLTGICLVEVIDGGKDYFYRVAGSALEEMTGQVLQGKYFSELIHAKSRESMRATCGASVETARPIVIKNQLREPGRGQTAITAIVLPLSDDGQTVNMLLTMTEFEGAS